MITATLIFSAIVAVNSSTSPGQAMDLAMKQIRLDAETHCGKWRYAVKEAKPQITVTYDPTPPFATAPVVSVQVSQEFRCDPW